MTTITRLITTAGLLVTVAALATPQAAGQAGKQTAAPAAKSSERTFTVKLDFNRWHDTAELQADMKALEKAYPKFLKYLSLGKSHGGRDIAAMIINNPDTGPDTSKPAMYIEANIHGNEVQGGEVCVYTIWYLMEHYGKIDQITKEGRSLHVRVTGKKENVSVNVPFHLAMQALPDKDGRIHTAALAGALGGLRFTDLVDVQDGKDHVRIYVW